MPLEWLHSDELHGLHLVPQRAPREEGSVRKEARYIHREPVNGVSPAVDILVGGEMQQADLTDHFRNQQLSDWVF